MRLIKLLEGLYTELKIYNENEARKEEKRLRRVEPLTARECAWIRSQLALKSIRIRDIAKTYGCHDSVISRTLQGMCQSITVEDSLAEVLGYESIDQLKAAATTAEEDITVAEKKEANANKAIYAWIKSRLVLKNIRLGEIAKRAKINPSTLSNFLCEKITSKKIESVIADALGYPSWDALWADAVAGAKGGAA